MNGHHYCNQATLMPCLNPKEGTVNGEMQVFFGQLGRYAEAW